VAMPLSHLHNRNWRRLAKGFRQIPTAPGSPLIAVCSRASSPLFSGALATSPTRCFTVIAEFKPFLHRGMRLVSRVYKGIQTFILTPRPI